LFTGSDINALSAGRIEELLKKGLDTRPFFELSQTQPAPVTPGRCAAVLVPLARVEGEWHLLLIKRSETVADHKGQVAFPGGACEAGDGSLETTALRETAEEIGILPDDIKILGSLRDLVTVSGFYVAPIVGVIKWPYPLKLSEEEVSRAFTIPLAWLADPENRETRMLNRLGRDVEVIYYRPYEDEVLWGATARMVSNLIEVLIKKM
jgi:8-oxo-dGTP pyrophosphatase MutT (NUDIX family)